MSDTMKKPGHDQVADKKLEVNALLTGPEELTRDQADKTHGGAGELARWAGTGRLEHRRSHGLISHRTG